MKFLFLYISSSALIFSTQRGCTYVLQRFFCATYWTCRKKHNTGRSIFSFPMYHLHLMKRSPYVTHHTMFDYFPRHERILEILSINVAL